MELYMSVREMMRITQRFILWKMKRDDRMGI